MHGLPDVVPPPLLPSDEAQMYVASPLRAVKATHVLSGQSLLDEHIATQRSLAQTVTASQPSVPAAFGLQASPSDPGVVSVLLHATAARATNNAESQEAERTLVDGRAMGRVELIHK